MVAAGSGSIATMSISPRPTRMLRARMVQPRPWSSAATAVSAASPVDCAEVRTRPRYARLLRSRLRGGGLEKRIVEDDGVEAGEIGRVEHRVVGHDRQRLALEE